MFDLIRREKVEKIEVFLMIKEATSLHSLFYKRKALYVNVSTYAKNPYNLMFHSVQKLTFTKASNQIFQCRKKRKFTNTVRMKLERA